MSALPQAVGVFQTDLIVRSAIELAFKDLRENSWLLDYCFKSLTIDTQTSAQYGQREIDRAKEWFLTGAVGRQGVDIPVLSGNVRMAEVPVPCITVSMVDSSETENTLADVNYVTDEQSTYWPVLAGPFEPLTYDYVTGQLTVPPSVLLTTQLYTGMIITDRTGAPHPIINVVANNIAAITPGTQADFTNATIKAAQPYNITIESVNTRENLLIGCHVSGQPAHLQYLHSIVVFALWRYRQSLLEARGFERSSFNSTDFSKNAAFSSETVFSRWINLTGFVRHSWPKERVLVAQGVQTQLDVLDSGKLPSPASTTTAPWIGDLDASSLGRNT